MRLITGMGAGAPDACTKLFETNTVTGAAVAVFPLGSRTIAESAWLPPGTAVVFQLMPYGGVVSSAPRFAPSRVNWTPATPSSSVAVAVIETVPATVDPLAGAVIETLGASEQSFVLALSGVWAERLPAESTASTASV